MPREITLFLAPYVNSYKRFTVGLFAPTKAVWSARQPHRGLPRLRRGDEGRARRMPVGGSDLNPYLALAALLAAGLDGIERKLELEPELKGDMLPAEGIREIPRTLREAADLAARLEHAARGDGRRRWWTTTIHAALWEISEADRVVTDWDVKRGFERA
jgi:glutamine synthetase